MRERDREKDRGKAWCCFSGREGTKIEQLLTLLFCRGDMPLGVPTQSQVKHLLFKINVQKSLLMLQRMRQCGETDWARRGDAEITAAGTAVFMDISANLQP